MSSKRERSRSRSRSKNKKKTRDRSQDKNGNNHINYQRKEIVGPTLHQDSQMLLGIMTMIKATLITY